MSPASNDMIYDMLKHQQEQLDDIRAEVVALGKEVSGLKVKAGVWGAVAGMIPVAALLLERLVSP